MKRILFIVFIALFFPALASASALTDWLENTAGGKSDYTLTQLWADGFVDVQWFNDYNGYDVDASGVVVSTDGIIACINLVHSHDLPPPGTWHTPKYTILFSHQASGARGIYLIDDTIMLRQKDWGNIHAAFTRRHALVGAKDCTDLGSPRPLIQLNDSAVGFNSTSSPKPMVWFWRETTNTDTNPVTQHDYDRNFDNIFRGIDLDVGTGNAGAIGLEYYVAQGAVIEDVDIDATGGFAGIGNIAAYSTLHANITITGGLYAISNLMCNDTGYLHCYNGSVGYKHHFDFVGCTFTDQTIAVVNLGTRQVHYIMFVGCHISNSGSIGLNNGAFQGDSVSMLLDRCLIEMGSATTLLQDTWTRTAVIRDTYTKNIRYIRADGTEITNLTDYSHIKEYSYSIGDYYNMTNGATQTQTKIEDIDFGITYSQAAIIAALITPTIWDEDTFPDYWDADIYNPVLSTTHGDAVDNTGATDCTADLQDAIDYCDTNDKTLFLPRGHYALTSTITLKADSRIIGMGKDATALIAAESWQPTAEAIILTTENSTTGTAILSCLSVRHEASTSTNSPTHAWFTLIEWKVGEDSQMRNVMAGIYTHGDAYISSGDQRWWSKKFKVTGGGGGRWWSPLTRGRGMDIDANSLYIENASEPLYIYGWNCVTTQHSTSMDIINSDNVVIYNNDQEGNQQTSLRVADSDNIKHFGGRMNETPTQTVDRGYIEFDNCNNVFVGGITVNSSDDYDVVREVYGESTSTIGGPGGLNVATFRRGTFPYISISESEPDTSENSFSGPNTFAVYNFESGALTTDSKGSNTWLPGTAPSADSVNYKQGSASALFLLSSSQYYYITDGGLDSGYPLKSGDSQKTISVCSWVRLTTNTATNMLYSRYDSGATKRTFMVTPNSFSDNNKPLMWIGHTNGTLAEKINWHGSNAAVTISTGTWYHMSFAYRNSDKAYAIRVRDTSGNVVGTDHTGTTTNNIYVSDARAAIGCFYGGASTPTWLFNGNADELVIFDKFLTAEDSTNLAKGLYGKRGRIIMVN